MALISVYTGLSSPWQSWVISLALVLRFSPSSRAQTFLSTSAKPPVYFSRS